MSNTINLEWARQFFTSPRFSATTAIDVYGKDAVRLTGAVRYYLGAAVREYTRGEG